MAPDARRQSNPAGLEPLKLLAAHLNQSEAGQYRLPISSPAMVLGADSACAANRIFKPAGLNRWPCLTPFLLSADAAAKRYRRGVATVKGFLPRFDFRPLIHAVNIF